jgi:hypothetical protein
MPNLILSKIFPQFFGGNANDVTNDVTVQRIPRELFEEAVRKIFPLSSEQVSYPKSIIFFVS